MITRFTTAEIVVVGLIGERGREVGNFVSSNLNEDTKKRTVMVVEPADKSPLLRIRAKQTELQQLLNTLEIKEKMFCL